MGYFEFLPELRILCLPLNISEKLDWQRILEKVEEAEACPVSFVNIIQYPRTLKNNIYHSNKRGPPPFFNNILYLVHSVDKTHVLVVTMELIWSLLLNILSFNFVQTPNKSLKSTRLRRSYVNHSVVVLTNHCQSYTAFLVGMRCSKWQHSFFYSFLSAMIVHFHNLFLLNAPVGNTATWESRRNDMK